MIVTETFFAVPVADIERARAFYIAAFDATASFVSFGWVSLHIAGVRVGLALDAAHVPERIGLHFAVRDLAEARARVERAGGRVVTAAIEVAPGVVLSEVADTEGNSFSLRG